MRRGSTVLSCLLLAAALTASAVGGSTPVVKRATAPPAAKRATIDLATYDAKRWIVQLRGAPLAAIGIGGRTFGPKAAGAAHARVAVSSARSAPYVAQLKSAQRAFTTRLLRAVPGARVHRTYQVVLGGLAGGQSNAGAGVKVADELPGLLPEQERRGLPDRQRLHGRARRGDRGRGRVRRRRGQQLLGLDVPEHARVARPGWSRRPRTPSTPAW